MTTAKERRPGGETGAASKSRATDYHQNSGNYRHDCGHVIATDSSLARMRGPHCHAKAKAVAE